MKQPADSAVLTTFRAPSVPLVTHTPYFSVWSPCDRLTDTWAEHWTEAHNSLGGLVRIDDVCYRFSGPEPRNVPAMEQISVEITATRSIYTFESAGVRLTAEFLSPLLADDLDILARPVTYVTITARSTDHQAHDVAVYLDVAAEWCVNQTGEAVYASRHRIDGLVTMAFRSVDQPVLKRKGDHIRIDWGTLLLSTPQLASTESAIGSNTALRDGFAQDGVLPATDDMRFPRPASDGWPIMAVSFSLGLVGADETNRTAMVAYDEEFAVEYLGRRLPPYWRRHGDEIGALLSKANADYADLRLRCVDFDRTVWTKAAERGGEDYAQLCSLAYRQCLAAHGLVEDVDGTLLMFSKENDSNGCIGTVDVTYPGSPFFLYFNPAMLQAQIEPILQYAGSARWRFPFAPHDLGTYPQANGQVYGGGERDERDQMPVEECGNMLILVAALAQRTGDTAWLAPYWPTLDTWAAYLLQCGLDPDNQLCTDDFAGHMAHNANLAIKAIVGLGAYGKLRGAENLLTAARKMAAEWLNLAADGDHTRLAYDQPGSWSQKYNLVWDRILDLGLFPADLARNEIAFYLDKLNEYGLPLDSRKDYTKLDWCVWTATLTENRQDFDAIVSPLLAFCKATPDRVPLTDWYDTKTAKQMAFQARSVVGGVFLPLL